MRELGVEPVESPVEQIQRRPAEIAVRRAIIGPVRKQKIARCLEAIRHGRLATRPQNMSATGISYQRNLIAPTSLRVVQIRLLEMPEFVVSRHRLRTPNQWIYMNYWPIRRVCGGGAREISLFLNTARAASSSRLG